MRLSWAVNAKLSGATRRCCEAKVEMELAVVGNAQAGAHAGARGRREMSPKYFCRRCAQKLGVNGDTDTCILSVTHLRCLLQHLKGTLARNRLAVWKP